MSLLRAPDYQIKKKNQDIRMIHNWQELSLPELYIVHFKRLIMTILQRIIGTK